MSGEELNGGNGIPGSQGRSHTAASRGLKPAAQRMGGGTAGSLPAVRAAAAWAVVLFAGLGLTGCASSGQGRSTRGNAPMPNALPAAAASPGPTGTRPDATYDGPTATGVVFHDRNRNGTRDRNEPGIREVRVSNGREVVLTDRDGRYRLPVDDDTILFVIKPSGWMTPLNEQNLPRFHYIHKPAGSPSLRYAGVQPTGPLPDSVDFPLHRQREPKKFNVVYFGDPQPYTIEEVDFYAHDVVEDVMGTDAAFGVSLGDLVGDDLSLFEPLNAATAHVGIPWYHVYGNHDMNFDSPDDEHADETFERVYGPACYAFDYADVHFVVIDDVFWTGAGYENKGKYVGRVGQRQLEFIRNNLLFVPRDKLVVLMMHIPLTDVEDRADLFELLSDRPRTFSIAAHHHTMHHSFYGRDEGWDGSEPHHHFVNATTSGSWWRGVRDEEDIPHTTMRDGGPNGYTVATFDGGDYRLRFQAARRPADHQMTIYAPNEVPLADAGSAEIVVNVFAGSEKSTVEMRLGGEGDWRRLERVEREDPFYLRLKAEEALRGDTDRKLPRTELVRHLWQAPLPKPPSPGTYVVEVRTKDMFGQTYEDRRMVRFTP